MSVLSAIWKNYKAIPSAIKTGQRLSRIRGENVVKGLSYGVQKAGRQVGTFPLVTAGLCSVCVPFPGAASVGFVAGSLLKEGIKVGTKLMKIG